MHINDIRRRIQPVTGDRVRFQLKKDPSGKTIISEARLIKFSALSTLSWTGVSSVASIPFILSIISLKRSAIALALYTCMSATCFAMIKIDKERAKTGRWRIPDSSLHLAHWLGGWPGTLISQKIYLHKANKKSFQGNINFIICIHAILWTDYLALNHLLLNGLIRGLQYLARL